MEAHIWGIIWEFDWHNSSDSRGKSSSKDSVIPASLCTAAWRVTGLSAGAGALLLPWAPSAPALPICASGQPHGCPSSATARGHRAPTSPMAENVTEQ